MLPIDYKYGDCTVGKNNITYNKLFTQYSNLAMQRYKWKNLPHGLESRIIEKYLYQHGQVFFTDETDLGIGVICLPCSSSGEMNLYGEPTKVICTGFNYHKTFWVSDGCRLLDNYLARPLIYTIQYYCERLEHLLFSIETNLDQQNNPYIFSTTKETELTMKNIFKKIKDRAPAIFVDNKFNNGEGISIHTTDISKPYTVDKYREEYKHLENELLTMLGINTVVNKESGMNEVELNANNLLIGMYINEGLTARKELAERLNEKYGLNVEVEATVQTMPHIEEFTNIDLSKYED